jgi:hypothetical protein
MKGLLKKSSGRRSIQRNAFSTMAQTKVIRAPVFKGTVTPMRGVLDHIAHPDYAFSGRPKTSPKLVSRTKKSISYNPTLTLVIMITWYLSDFPILIFIIFSNIKIMIRINVNGTIILTFSSIVFSSMFTILIFSFFNGHQIIAILTITIFYFIV